MLKVLIADDEIKVCRLISCLIDWEAMGLSVIGMVHDGLSAFRFIKEYTPDIVITDIKMPRYDGLELIKNAREYNSDIHFIIISGYSDFSYAQKAIKFGVEDYLLKPIKKKELELALNKLIMSQQQLENNRKEKEIMHRRITHATQKAKGSFLKELLEKPEDFRKYSGTEEINNIYCCRLTEGYYQVIALLLTMQTIPTDSNMAEFMTAKAKDVIANELSAMDEVLSIHQDGTIYCLLNGTAVQFEEIRKHIKKIRSLLLGFQDVFGKLRLTIALSSVKESFLDIYDCFDEARNAALNRVISPPNPILYFDETCIPTRKTDELLNHNFRKRFLFNIETFHFDDQAMLFSELKTAIKVSEDLNGAFILQIYKDLIDLFHFGVKNCGIHIKQENYTAKLLSHFHCCHTIDDIFDYMYRQFSDYLFEWKEEKKLESTKPIRTAKQFIKIHYAEPLTLEIIGNQIGLNSSYFSSIFKKETGVSFVEYLTEVRIEASKQMLAETNDSILIISERSGFNDLKYFNKKFRQITGLNPTDYRKLYS